MLKYFNEITQNGQKTNGFALKAAKLICTEYGLKLGKYARVRKQLPSWYTGALDNANKQQQAAEEKKEDVIVQQRNQQKASKVTSGGTSGSTPNQNGSATAPKQQNASKYTIVEFFDSASVLR